MHYVFLAEGFEEIEAVTIIDTLRRADMDVQTVSITENTTVVGAHGIAVLADITLASWSDEQPESLILPGGMPGTRHLMACKSLQDLLISNVNKSVLAAICAAPMILGELHLLNGKDAVCYPGFEAHLLGADVRDDQVVQDGRIITSRGPGTALSFAYALVEHFKGDPVAEKLKRAMIYQG